MNFKIIKEKESKAAQEIKYLKNFSHWPTAKAKAKYSFEEKSQLKQNSKLIVLKNIHEYDFKDKINVLSPQKTENRKQLCSKTH